MDRVLAVVVVLLVVVGPLAAVGAVAPGSSTSGVDEPQMAAADPQTDNTVTRIEVRANGDARWTVRIRTRLETESDVEDYEAFQREFRNDTASYRDPFAERIRGVVADAANATGREMAVRNVSASTSIQELPRRWGVVSFTFTWTNFARPDGEALVVGDVFEGGLLLAENDTLVVVAPSGYEVDDDSVDPAPDASDDDSVTWEGQRDFGDRRPRARLVPAGSPADTPPPTGPGDRNAGLGAIVLLGLVVAAGLLGGLFLAWRHTGLGDSIAPTRISGESGSAGESGPSGGTGSAAADADTGGSPPVLTDGERVEQLVADAGGRMKQAAVADELGWSDSKTSRVVSRLVDDGRVEKLRVGRENVLDLQDDQD